MSLHAELLILLLILIILDIPEISCYRNVHGYIHLVRSYGYFYEGHRNNQRYSNRAEGFYDDADSSANKNLTQRDYLNNYKYNSDLQVGIDRWTTANSVVNSNTITRIDGFSPYRSRRQRLRYNTLKSYQSNHRTNDTVTIHNSTLISVDSNRSRTDSIPSRGDKGTTRQGASSSSSNSRREGGSDTIAYYKPEMFCQQLEYDYLSPNSLYTIQLLPHHRRNKGDYFLTKWWHVAKKWDLLSGEMKEYADMQGGGRGHSSIHNGMERVEEEQKKELPKRFDGSASIRDQLDTSSPSTTLDIPSRSGANMVDNVAPSMSLSSIGSKPVDISMNTVLSSNNSDNNNNGSSLIHGSTVVMPTDGGVVDSMNINNTAIPLIGSSDGSVWVNRLSSALRQHIESASGVVGQQQDPSSKLYIETTAFPGGMSRKDFNRIRNYKGRLISSTYCSRSCLF